MLRPNATGQMFFMPRYPFWSLTIIAADIRQRQPADRIGGVF
jgi:hypothetical protein